MIVKLVVGWIALSFPLATIVGRALGRAADTQSVPECAFGSVTPITADELTGADIGALCTDETGWIGWCACGWRSWVRYSRQSAKTAVVAHVIGAPSDVPTSRVWEPSR